MDEDFRKGLIIMVDTSRSLWLQSSGNRLANWKTSPELEKLGMLWRQNCLIESDGLMRKSKCGLRNGTRLHILPEVKREHAVFKFKHTQRPPEDRGRGTSRWAATSTYTPMDGAPLVLEP